MSGKKSAWEYLEKRDIVEIVAPASACSSDELQSALASVKSMGFTPRIPEEIFADHPFLSHNDTQRFRYLKEALQRKDSKVVWCLRGGYGSLRLLPFLSKLKKPVKPKLLIGLSDISTLHNFLVQYWKWPSLHGPMLGSFATRTLEDKKEVLDILTGETKTVEFTHLTPMNEAAKKTKSIVGSFVGGNLMTVQSSQGTPWRFHAHEKIAFFEEVNERGYRLDRLLVSLQQSDYLKNCKAVVLGEFLGGNEPDGKNYVEDVLQQFASEIKIPVVRGVASGHGSSQRTVPFGTKATLKLGTLATLEIETNGYFASSRNARKR